jgi:[acyl-carrier-protein] S-malonyltransferase
MTAIAFVFPGQGSQFPGMGKDLVERFPEAKQVYERADAALAPFGVSISKLSFEGTEADLKQTAITQPAILTHSAAVFAVLRARGVAPTIAAGHSLGEYSALVAAGALAIDDAVPLVHRRGTFMQEAVPAGQGAMSAVIGLDPAEVARVCAEAAEATGEACAAANYNSPEQTVIAGTAAAVARAGELLKAKGAKRVLPLPVSAPFHCALMAPAAEKLLPYLQETTFSDMTFPVITNVDVIPNMDFAAAREALVRQVCSPVRWVETVKLLATLSESGIEVGPGAVLQGLAKRIEKAWVVKTTSTADGVEALLRELAPS